jgi:heme a synthase
MAGQFFPPNVFAHDPWWVNFVENPGLVQFIHRMVGYLLVVLGILAWWRSRASSPLGIRRAFDAVLVVMLAQVVLGIVTVLNAAPWPLAIAHQFGAIVLFVAVIGARFRTQFPREERIARA